VNIDRDAEPGNPFQNGLTILARIISRVYRRDLFFSNLYIPAYGALTYSGAQNYFKWHITGEDGVSYLIMATMRC
jgi:hypothetical protein